MKVTIYTQTGQTKGEIELKKELFAAPINEGLMHEAMVRQLGNARIDTAFSKTRGEIRGGGRKPHRQKGTGRARQGSIRSPQHRGGGVVFGPRGSRNYAKQMPKKQRRAALFSALSLKAEGKEVLVLNAFETEKPKTKLFAQMLSKLPVQRKILLVLPEANMVIEKSASNLQNVRVLHVQYLNIIDLLWADTVLFLEPALKKAEEIFLDTKKEVRSTK